MTSFVGAPALRSHWFMVAESRELDDSPLAITLLGQNIVLFRDGDGAAAAAPDRCPHREAPLSIGWCKDGLLRCAYHGWAFDGTGTCVEVPSSGPDAAIAPTAHLDTLAVEELYGLVWICPGEPTGRPPTVAHEHDPAFRRINSGVERWKVSTPRLLDNFMDFSHFPWVHTGTFGGAQDPMVPKLDIVDLPDGYVGFEYEVQAANPDEATAISGSDDDVVHRFMTTGFHLPFSVRSTIRYDHGLEHILLLCSTPVSDDESLFTFVVWRNDDHSEDPEEIIAFDRAIGAEDKAMLERIPGTLPLTATGVSNTRSDRGSVEWKRRFSELIGVTS